MSLWTHEQLTALIDKQSDRPEWLVVRQKNMLEQFLAQGFPTRALPAWQYTSTQCIQSSVFDLSLFPSMDAVQTAQAWISAAAQPYDLVFLNGYYMQALSHAEVLKKSDISVSCIKNYHDKQWDKLKYLFNTFDSLSLHEAPFYLLAQALLTEHVTLTVPDHTRLEQPIRVLHLCEQHFSNCMQHVHFAVQMARRTRLVLTEEFQYLNSSAGLTNAVTSIHLHPSAQLQYYHVQPTLKGHVHLHQLLVCQKMHSVFTHYDFARGANLARNDRRIYLQGEQAKSYLKGLYISRENKHIDHYIYVKHNASNTESHQMYKGLVTDAGRAVFNSHILIPEKIKHTVAKQSNQNLLLSNDAEINIKPILEIYADDVQCGHGAAIGALDENALFYLCSRGIPAQEAETLLEQGFVNEVFDQVEEKSLISYFKKSMIG
jgi:Fe-S cluster assembly protein SufD